MDDVARDVDPQLSYLDRQPHTTERAAAGPVLSTVAILPLHDQEGSKRLVEWGRILLGLGDQYRAVSAQGWLTRELSDAGIPYTTLRCASTGGSARADPGLLAYTGAILHCLQSEPTDIVQCQSVRSSYAAALAIYLLAFCRPHFREPTLVTMLPQRQTDARAAMDAHYLRHVCDALIVRSSEEFDAIALCGFPRERLHIIPEPGVGVAGVRAVYVEACGRAARRAQWQMVSVV